METVSVETFDKDGLQCGSVVFDTEDFDLKAYPVVVYRPVAYFLLSVWNEEKCCWEYVCGKNGEPLKKDLSLLNLEKRY